jgi:hypothetical protein
MPITERTSHRLVLKSGSTMLTLDKTADKAILQRTLLLWGLKPVQASLSELATSQSTPLSIAHQG